MSEKDYITKVLDMEDGIIEGIKEEGNELKLTMSLERKAHPCPACGAWTERVHDYRVRRLRDLEIAGKKTEILYRRRRYICENCGKKFAERCTFAGRYQRCTHRVTLKIIELLHKRSSLKLVAESTGTSPCTVGRVLNTLSVSGPEQLPEAISFDEFKGNLGGERFQCIVTDPLNRRVLDILPARTVETVQDYLRTFANRDKVKYVVMDMNKGFFNVAQTFLPNAKIIIDRFHVVRFCTEAMDNVRREVQKSLPNSQRKYFKRSRRLLLAHRQKLSEEDKLALDVILRFSDKLAQAYALKEAFYHFMASANKQEADHRLEFWLDSCDRLPIPQFFKCRKMLRNWRACILNAFDIRLSNGFTEGCNNAVKALKRASFGFSNFSRSRKRILLSFHPYI